MSASDQDDRPGPIVLGAVLCGGRSSRFGSDKALAPLGESTVGASVVDALRGAGVDPVVAIGGTAGSMLAIPTVPDLRPGDGPLAGLATALLWARTGPVLVTPCDLPLLRAGHVRLILDAYRATVANPQTLDGDDMAVVATVDGEPQLSLAVWPATRGRTLLRALDGGTRAFRAALDHGRWCGVEIPPEAVADADTPEELTELRRSAGVDEV